MTGPLCSAWAGEDDLPSTPAPPSLPNDLKWDDLLLEASEVLYGLSGERFPGACESTVVVTSRPRGDRTAGPLGWDRSWGWCTCTGLGSCCTPDLVRLPDPAVLEVTSVVVDGAALPAGTVELVGDRYVRRVDGHRWATCAHPATITYRHGVTPPTAGKSAAVALAVELAKARLNDDSCKLPGNVTQIVRQGTTMTVASASQVLSRGQTGIYAVDLFLASSAAPARPTAWLWSPDLDTHDTTRIRT